MSIRPYGEDALLIDVPDAAHARSLGRRLLAELPGLVVDAVPSAVSVLLRLAPGWSTEQAIRRARPLCAPTSIPPTAEVDPSVPGDAGDADVPDDADDADVPAPVEIPVVYDGADLAEVAARCGLTPADVVARHTAPIYTAAFAGFAPGFVYLEGLDPALVLPRRAEPRTRVPAGSVAIAADHAAVYPRESPGGWHLLGRTGAVMFDAEADPPALVQPGDRVRFVALAAAARPSATGAAGPDDANAAAAADPDRGTGPRSRSMSRGALHVLDPGQLTLTVDTGRAGRARWGVAPSGPFDRAASARANALVGNGPEVATLEVLLGPLVLEATRAVVAAVTGPAAVRVGDLPVEIERPFAVPAGERLTVRVVGGARVWLAVAGGIDVPPVLGSRTRDTLAGLGPSPLSTGDRLPVGDARTAPAHDPATSDGTLATPVAGEAGVVTLPVLPPPRPETLADTTWEDLLRGTWTVAAECDRVAVRLRRPRGGRVLAAPEASAASEGLVAGAVQLPPSGQPLVFGPDHPLTGGYPVIGVVTAAGLGALAQLRPGDGVRFVPR